ncbi:MAG: Fic family protein [Balneolales bacterium]
MKFNPGEPYNDLPLLPPGTDVETKAVLKRLTAARASLAELKGSAAMIPNPLMLINTIVLQEAKASSEIENIFTTNDMLYKAFSMGPTTDLAAKEVLRYREALWNGYNHLENEKKFSTELFIRIARTIKEDVPGIRKLDPESRVVIGNAAKKHIIYTPPEGEQVILKQLENLKDFMNIQGTGVDPLIKMAIAHYQFEAIHPFADGNGRTGRILNILYLVNKNLLDLPILFLSKYIIEHKADYYRLLKEVTEDQEWEAWLIFILDAVRETSSHTLHKILAIKSLLDDTIEQIKKDHPQIYSRELVDVLFMQPYCKISHLVDNQIATRNTASKYLNTLAGAGILEKQKSGRETLYLNIKLYDVLGNYDVER